jgi:hypothetical protein
MPLPSDYWVFRKRWTDSTGVDSQRFSYRGISFAPLLSRDHRQTFDPSKPIPTSQPFADIIASAYAHIITSFRPESRLLREGLLTCEQVMQDLGYQLTTEIRDVTQDHHGCRAALLVPGCQSHLLIKPRAVVGAEVYHRLMTDGIPTKCLLSGARPNWAKVTIWNESVVMRRHFTQFLAKLEGKRLEELGILRTVFANDVNLDGISERTQANVSEFMKKVIEQKEGSGEKPLQIICVVSSTFHLIRLAGFLEIALRKYWEQSNPPEGLELVLIGAETDEHVDSEGSAIVADRDYVKPLFFEVINYLIQTGRLPGATT